MGTWGSGLYSNDMAVDLRDDFSNVCRAPWNGDDLLRWALAEYPMLDDPADDAYTDLRLVLADLFWTYGIDHDETFAIARRIVTDGSDLSTKRALGMSERDLKVRATMLAKLDKRWLSPNPKPRPRRIIAQPEPFLFEVGDCLVYPTSRGELRNPYVAPAAEERHYRSFPWTHDGWGTAIVLARYRQYDVFARYGICLLAASAATKPSPSDVATMSILHMTPLVPWPPDPRPQPTRRQVHGIAMSRQHRQRMQIEVVGRLAVNARLVASEITPQIVRHRLDNALANVAMVAKRLTPVDDPIARYLE